MGVEYSALCKCTKEEVEESNTEKVLNSKEGNKENKDKMKNDIEKYKENPNEKFIEDVGSLRFIGKKGINDKSNYNNINNNKEKEKEKEYDQSNFSNYVIDSNNIINEYYQEDEIELNKNPILIKSIKKQRNDQSKLEQNKNSYEEEEIGNIGVEVDKINENIGNKVEDNIKNKENNENKERKVTVPPLLNINTINNPKKRDQNKTMSKNNISYLSYKSKKTDYYDIFDIIPIEEFKKISEFDVIFQSEIMKYNYKISSSYNHNVSYLNRFILFCKKDIRIYKNKESFLHLFPPLIKYDTDKISYCSIINIPNKKGIFHFSFLYDYPSFLNNPIVNDYYSSNDQSIVYKELSKTRKPLENLDEHRDFQEFCDHLVILSSNSIEDVEKWMGIFRYCVMKKNE